LQKAEYQSDDLHRATTNIIPFPLQHRRGVHERLIRAVRDGAGCDPAETF
jgi:hypothetical protein